MSLLSRPVYRTRQLAGALRPRLSADERAEADRVLGDQLATLFKSMSLRDRRHCFDVYKMLLSNGCRDSDILMAALLHDAGKGRLAGAKVRLWHRVAYVALAASSPALLRLLARSRGGLASLHHHSERGAVLADALGATTPVVGLIRRHEEADAGDERLHLLRMADDAC